MYPLLTPILAFCGTFPGEFSAFVLDCSDDFKTCFISRGLIDYCCCEKEDKQFISAMLEKERKRSFLILKMEVPVNVNLEKTRAFVICYIYCILV